MAGPLTWRNVAAPDFSTSLEGIKAFGSMINNAFSGLQRGLGDYDQSITDRVNKEIMANLMTQRDPQALTEAISSGDILSGYNPRRVNFETLSAINAAPTQRLEEQGRFRTNRLAEAQDKAAPLVAQAISQANSNDPSERAKAMATLGQLPEGMGLQDILNVSRNIQQTEQGRVGIAGDILRNEGQVLSNEGAGIRNRSAAREYNWQGEDREFARQADELAGVIRQNSFDSLSMEQNLNGLGLDGRTYNAVAARLNLPTTPDYASMGGIPFGSGEGLDYTGFLANIESNNNPNARAPTSSATGLFQFTDGTWLNTVKKANPSWARGLNPDQIKALRTNPEYQREMEAVLRQENAQALERAGAPINGANLYAIHHFGGNGVKFAQAGNNTRMEDILSPEQIKANPYLRGKTKADAISNWAKRGGVSPDALMLSGSITAQGMRNAHLQRNAGNLATSYVTAYRDNRDVAEVATELSESTFKGGTPAYIGQKINEVIAKAKGEGITLNAALAGEILKKSVGSSMFSRFTGGVGGGFNINSDRVDELIKSFQGDLDRAVTANDRAAGLVAQQQMANQQLAAAQARLVTAQRAAQAGKPVNLAQIQQDYERAAQNKLMLDQAIGNDPAAATFGQPPDPDPIAQTTGGESESQTPSAFARDSSGRYTQEGSAGSRARAAELISRTAPAAVTAAALGNPALLLLRSFANR